MYVFSNYFSAVFFLFVCRMMTSSLGACGVCDYRHITKPSIVWCAECGEGLCEECKTHHSISKGTRCHVIVSISDYQKLPSKVLQIAQYCDKHNEKYQIYCNKHDCPCCKKCIVESHNDCIELTDIDDITRHIKSSNAFAEIELTLTDVAENINRLRTNREHNLASLGRKSKEFEKEVQETRAKIDKYLDKLQDDILKDLKTREEEESNKIRRLLKELLDKEKQIIEHQADIANLKQYASELQTFLALQHIENDVLADEEYIQSMIKRDGVNQIDLSCKIDKSLHGIISSIQKFGDVTVRADSCNISIQKHKEKQAQMMVTVTPKTIDSLTPTPLQSFDTNLKSVNGCTLLPDCRMMFACSTSQILRMLKIDGSLEFEIRDFGCVFDVTLIGDNSIAVTSGYYRSSRQINLIDLKTRKVQNTLKVNSVNSGVACSSDKLIYSAGRNGIQMINLNDESIVNVTKSKVNFVSYVATFRDKIFYTHNDSVTCIDFQGNIQWVFIDTGVLHHPSGISVDGDGNVYVVGRLSNNLVVISLNGQNYRELLTSENGLKEPAVIHVDRPNYRMIIANMRGKAFLYTLK